MTWASVDEYIASFPDEVQDVLREMQRTIHRVVPGGEDVISYQIAAVKVDGKVLVYYAGWAKHVSLYPLPAPDEELEALIAPYRSGKGTVKFPLAEPIPYDLIERIVTLMLRQRTA